LLPPKLSLDPIAAALDHINPARHIRKRAGFSFVLTGHSSLNDANPEPLIQALDLLCLFPGTCSKPDTFATAGLKPDTFAAASLKLDTFAAAPVHINFPRHMRKRGKFSFVLTELSSHIDAHRGP